MVMLTEDRAAHVALVGRCASATHFRLYGLMLLLSGAIPKTLVPLMITLHEAMSKCGGRATGVANGGKPSTPAIIPPRLNRLKIDCAEGPSSWHNERDCCITERSHLLPACDCTAWWLISDDMPKKTEGKHRMAQMAYFFSVPARVTICVGLL